MKKIIHLEILDSMSQAIFDKKGMNILVLDVRGLSTMTDDYIIAEGTVDCHVKAISKGKRCSRRKKHRGFACGRGKRRRLDWSSIRRCHCRSFHSRFEGKDRIGIPVEQKYDCRC